MPFLSSVFTLLGHLSYVWPISAIHSVCVCTAQGYSSPTFFCGLRIIGHLHTTNKILCPAIKPFMVVEETSQNKTQCLLRLWSMTTCLCSSFSLPCVRVGVVCFDSEIWSILGEMGDASTETASRKVQKTALPIDEDSTLLVQNDFMIEPWSFLAETMTKIVTISASVEIVVK